jgi:transketolase
MDMKSISNNIRKTVINMAHASKGPHVGSALSCVDIISTLYFKVMNIQKPVNEDRDYFLLSKAHSAMALYATLLEKGFMTQEQIDGYYKSTLPAHTDKDTSDYVEISAGSLGHGLPMGLGMAHSAKLREEKNRVFVVMGDGEMQEGSVWEAAMLAPRLGLNNLTIFIDHNNLQGYGRATELVEFYPIKEKWESFGWETFVVDGHDHEAIEKACNFSSKKPKAIICNTTKGKDVSFMEDELIWHYYLVQDDHKEKALGELNEK